MFEKVIFHIDVNSAFLSWEAVYRLNHLNSTLDLRKIPSAVGGDIEKRHGIILAKSIPAKKFNIKTGESIVEAKQKCPDLYLTPPNYNLYKKSSSAFIQLLREYSDDIEVYSVDECFIDMTGTEHLFGNPLSAANKIKDRFKSKLGFTVNIGVSNNKLLAKMASDFKKPDMVHSLFPDEIEKKMWVLPVNDLFFVGRATFKKLHHLGIKTIGDLAKTDLNILKSHFKKHGEVIWNFANGIDLSPVVSIPPSNKGYGNSTTLPLDVIDDKTAKNVLLALSETVAARLRKDNVKAKVISVGIKNCDFQYTSHQMIILNATNITKEIHNYACQLFDEFWCETPIRHLCLHTSEIVGNNTFRQLELFDRANYEKIERLDQFVDEIRGRYGADAIKRATFLTGNIDHLSGGISREKRSIDYSKLKIE